jgi:hypothetical protein
MRASAHGVVGSHDRWFASLDIGRLAGAGNTHQADTGRYEEAQMAVAIPDNSAPTQTDPKGSPSPNDATPIGGPASGADDTQSRSVVLAVIIFLGLFSLVGLVGVIGLMANGSKTSSDIAPLTTLVAGAVGGLAAMLASTKTTK